MSPSQCKQREIHRRNISELWAMFDSGQLKPVVTDVFSMADYVEVFRCLTERRAKGKVILDIAE